MVPRGSLTKDGNYFRNSKDGSLISDLKRIKKHDPKIVTEVLNEKKAKKEIKKNPIIKFD